MIGGKDNDFLYQINVTPFIDIMLVLLVIFMVSSSVMIADFQVNLPHASAANERVMVSNHDSSSTLNVVINDSGLVTVQSKSIAHEEDLRAILGELNNSNVSVVIYADSAVTYGRIMIVMDMLKKNGVAKVSLAVKKSHPGAASL